MTKHWYLALLLLAVLCAAPVCAHAAGPGMTPGLWEITSQVEMPGMPMVPPPMTHTQCMTEDDAVPEPGQEEEGDCEILEQSVSGNTVTWKTRCQTDQGEVVSTGKITYDGDSFKGEVLTTMPGMKMTSKMSGRRVGPCPE